jgi:hypothetical protein
LGLLRLTFMLCGVVLLAVQPGHTQIFPARGTFRMDQESRSPIQEAVWTQWDKVPVPTLPAGEYLPQWEFWPGSPSEGFRLQALPPFPSPASGVTLPHRVSMPDHPFWYRCRISLKDSMVLALRADDGAQVWYRGQRILRLQPGEYFLLPAGTDDAELIVRVLNNAGAGGLRSAKLIPWSAWNAWSTEMSLYHQWEDLAIRYDRWEEAAEELGQAMLVALKMPLREPSLTIREALRPVPRIIAGPAIQRGQAGARYVWMESAPDPPARLLYMRATDRTPHILDGTWQEGLWRFTLSEDAPATDTLFWQVLQGGWITPVRSHRPWDPSRELSVVIWGDSQGGWDTFRLLQALPVLDDADLVIGLGDLVADGSQAAQWTRLWDILRPRMGSVHHLLIGGNHDYDGWYDELRPLPLRRYLQATPSPTHFLQRHGPAAFLALDPNGTFPIGIREEQWVWLRKALLEESWQGAEWRFLLIHQPPYAQGWPGYEGDVFIRDLLDSLYAYGPVDVVLSGHNHDFERGIFPVKGHPTLCVISGGGGGGLEPVENNAVPVMERIIKRHHLLHLRMSPERLEFTVLDTGGNTLDTFSRIKE